MIPDSFKADLLARANIVDVISRYVPVQKKGKDYTGICPFHDEKTASFTVSEAKGFYYCFGCARHGDALDFVMDYTGRGFREAVSELASMVGMQVPDQGPTDIHKVRYDRQNAAARHALLALEPELYIAAVGMADVIAGRKPSEADKSRFYESLAVILRGIEEAKGRKLTEAERRHILGEEQQEEVGA